jgi:glycerophosphoryl diester phosphodiesterase
MFKYVDANMFAFYDKLEKSWFFENWILLIISDHRKMQAVGKAEFDKYWYSFKSRALATIIWSWVKPQSINSNIIQHTDLFYSLKYLLGSWNVVVSSLFNNAFTNETSKDRWISYCRYFSDAKKYWVIKQNWQSYTLRSWYDQNIFDYMNAFEKFQYQRLFTGWVFMPWFFDNSGLIIIAHAWSPFLTTFDSPTWFKLAKENKADWIEFDVSYTKDDQNILMHWPSLASTKCWTWKNIKDFTLSYIQKNCKLLNWDPVFTLEDILNQTKWLFKYYFLEIKVYDQSKSEKQTFDAINTVLKLWMEKDVIFTSYDRMANYIIWSHKNIRAWWDSYYLWEVWLISKFPHEFFLISKDLINSKTVDVADKLNKKFVVYTIDTIEQFQKVYNLWARIIMTNNVPAINKILGR